MAYRLFLPKVDISRCRCRQTLSEERSDLLLVMTSCRLRTVPSGDGKEEMEETHSQISQVHCELS